MKNELCERCGERLAVSTEKYCKYCRPIIIRELEDCGYLQQLGDTHCGQRRTKEMKEDIQVTKHGYGNGAGH